MFQCTAVWQTTDTSLKSASLIRDLRGESKWGGHICKWGSFKLKWDEHRDFWQCPRFTFCLGPLTGQCFSLSSPPCRVRRIHFPHLPTVQQWDLKLSPLKQITCWPQGESKSRHSFHSQNHEAQAGGEKQHTKESRISSAHAGLKTTYLNKKTTAVEKKRAGTDAVVLNRALVLWP